MINDHDGQEDRIAAFMREIASGQRQHVGQLSEHLVRAVQTIVRRHFGDRRHLRPLTKCVVEAIIEGIARGEVADTDQFGPYARRMTVAMAAEPELQGGFGSKLLSLLPWRSQPKHPALSE